MESLLSSSCLVSAGKLFLQISSRSISFSRFCFVIEFHTKVRFFSFLQLKFEKVRFLYELLKWVSKVCFFFFF